MKPIKPLILRGLNCRRTLIHQEPLIVPPKLKCLLVEIMQGKIKEKETIV